MTNNEDQALNNVACGDPVEGGQVHPESAMPSIRAKDAAAAGEVDELLEAHAKAVIAAHECGETGGFYVNLRAAEQAIRDAIATAPAPQAAPVEAHPLDGLHINQGSMDAAADAYFIEWQKSKCRAAYENRYHKVAALCPYDEWEAAWFKAIAAIQAAPASQAATTAAHDPADEKQVEAWARRIAAEEALTVGLTSFEAVKRAALTQQASPEAPPKWRCFHCEESFTDRDKAALHFGYSERQAPACKLDEKYLRELEAEVGRYREEDTDLHRQIAGQSARLESAKRTAEEQGYARGLKDARLVPPVAAPEAPECDYRMPDGRLCPKCGNVHGSLATTASASREVCTTCGGSKVDPGGLPICRDCGRAPAPSREAAPVAGEGLAALDALAKQLARIHLSCRSNAPKLDVRDMLTAMRRMDEWKTLHALLAPTLDSALQSTDLIELLKAIRPSYGDVGSRDVDVAAQQKRIDRAIELLSACAPQEDRAAVPSFWNSQRKMIERAIIGLRDGWATRKDADDALAALVAAPVAQEGERSGAQAWEYSFIHSSAIGHGDSEIGPCLTYDRAQAYGVGCIKQREVWVATPSSNEASAQTAPVAVVDAGDEGLFVEILLGPNGSELKCGDKLYLGAQTAPANVRGTPWYSAACKMGNSLYNMSQAGNVPDEWKARARELVSEWDAARAAHPGDPAAGGKGGAS